MATSKILQRMIEGALSGYVLVQRVANADSNAQAEIHFGGLYYGATVFTFGRYVTSCYRCTVNSATSMIATKIYGDDMDTSSISDMIVRTPARASTYATVWVVVISTSPVRDITITQV